MARSVRWLPHAAGLGACTALAVAAVHPFSAAPAIMAVAVIGGIPLFALAALPADPESGGAYPEWRWATIYTATLFPLVLTALLVGSITAPMRLGTPDGRAVVITSIGSALLGWLPWVALRRGRRAAIVGIATAAVAGGIAFGWLRGPIAAEPELILAFAWVVGATLGGRSGKNRAGEVDSYVRLPATATVRIAVLQSCLAFILGVLVFVDWAIRNPT